MIFYSGDGNSTFSFNIDWGERPVISPLPWPWNAPTGINTNQKEKNMGLGKVAQKKPRQMVRIGSYVLATKWGDGDPMDQFCIGFVSGYTEHAHARYLIVDDNMNSFRPNGFRRVMKITADEGQKLCEMFPEISDKPGPSLWSYLRGIRRDCKKETKGHI